MCVCEGVCTLAHVCAYMHIHTEKESERDRESIKFSELREQKILVNKVVFFFFL